MKPPERSPGVRRAIAALAFAWMVAGAVAAVEVNRIVLRVNNRIVTLFDYEQRKQARIDAIRRAELSPEQRQELLDGVGEEVLRTLFEEMLLLSRADKLGAEVSQDEVLDAIDRTKASFGIENDEDFQKALAQSGMTFDELREQMRSNLLIQKVIGRDVRPRIELEDEDIRRYYQTRAEEFRLPVRLLLREMVVLDSGGLPAPEQQQLAADLRQRLVDGSLTEEDLAAYRDQGLATGWMELGWVQPGDLDPGIEAAVFDLEQGATSEPVAARGGVHLVQVVERKEVEQLSFAEVEEEIRRRESDRVFGVEMEEYMAELVDESFIVSRPPPEAAGFRAAEKRKRIDPLAKLGAPVEPDPTSPPQ